MRKTCSIFTIAIVLFFTTSAMAADKVVVIPLGSIKPTGDTVAEYVLEGTIFSNNDGVGIEGTMPNVGQQNITPGTNPQPITKGYHDGTGTVATDTYLVPMNIKSGITIFGVIGNVNVVDTTNGDATNKYILKNKSAYVKGNKIIGNNGLFWGCRPGLIYWTAGGCIMDCDQMELGMDCILICGRLNEVIHRMDGEPAIFIDEVICGGSFGE